ncbi:MAG: aminotransferase class V-fold PLP-dependent enzyme [Chloroflexi bacterium]|nr:aminotransferase class V-fold PLP-dependent enzyme [Chloroflexota bacterium]
MKQQIYADHAATTPLRPEVLAAMLPHLEHTYGNPSSLYAIARVARRELDRARDEVAALLGAQPDEVVFTSGGTESDNLAVRGVALASERRRVVTTSVEHHAVLYAARDLERFGYQVSLLPVNEFGMVDVEVLSRTLDEDTALVSVMLANNEVGTIQPVAELARICRARGVPFHTDAVQAVGVLPVRVDELGVDLLSLSAHKLYGPKGVGALYVRRGTPLARQVAGGAQEHERRAGTENVPGCVGLAVALRLALAEQGAQATRLAALRDDLIRGVLANAPGAELTGHPWRRLPGHVSLVFGTDGGEAIEGESVLLNLDFRGIAASSGSACTSGSIEPSHVLAAMGYPEEKVRSSLRLTLGRSSTPADVAAIVAAVGETIRAFRSGSG